MSKASEALKHPGSGDEIRIASRTLAAQHVPNQDQAVRLLQLGVALARFLDEIVSLTEPGEEREQAIARAREAKFWAAASVALEDK